MTPTSDSRPAAATSAAPGARRVHMVLIVSCLALAVSVIGLFLPWLRSGSVERSSFASIGVLDRLLNLTGPAHWAATVWPVLPLWCAMVVAAAALRFVVAAATLSVLPTVFVIVVAIAAVQAPSQLNIRIVTAGPLVSLVSAAVALAGFCISLFLHVRLHPRRNS